MKAFIGGIAAGLLLLFSPGLFLAGVVLLCVAGRPADGDLGDGDLAP